MHPAHVPLEAEAEPAQIGGPGDHGPGGGFLGDGEHAREHAVHHLVGLAQEADRRQVLPAAVLVGHPLPVLARVVEIEHGGHGVHAQPVDVVLVDPEQGVGDEEGAHLVAAVVEDQRAPVLVFALQRVGVGVQLGAVEHVEAGAVLGEMGRHPVEDHAQAGGMAPVDEVHEILGRAEAAGGREEAEHLVAPGAVEGVFGDGQHLDVGVAHLLDVGDEGVGHLPVGEIALAPLLVGLAAPGSEMHLVDGDRSVQGLAAGAVFHPVVVLPLVAVQVGDHRAGARPLLHEEAEGIGLVDGLQILGGDAVLVHGKLGQARDEQRPDAGVRGMHGVGGRIPAVEIAHHRHLAGVGRPDGEHRAFFPLELHQVGPKLFVGPFVGAFADQVPVEMAEPVSGNGLAGGDGLFHGGARLLREESKRKGQGATYRMHR